MALCASGHSFEIREVLLSNKPPQLIDLSAKATVPVLQLITGQVLEESLEIMCWALEKNDPFDWLDPEYGTLDDMLELIKSADKDFKFNLDHYKYSQRYEDVDPLFYRREGEKFIKILDDMLGQQTYLFGVRPSLADYAIVPFIRQFANTERIWFEGLRYTALHKWLDNFLTNKHFTKTMGKYLPWQMGDKPTIFVGDNIE
jgi:glutathione S-transferase